MEINVKQITKPNGNIREEQTGATLNTLYTDVDAEVINGKAYVIDRVIKGLNLQPGIAYLLEFDVGLYHAHAQTIYVEIPANTDDVDESNRRVDVLTLPIGDVFSKKQIVFTPQKAVNEIQLIMKRTFTNDYDSESGQKEVYVVNGTKDDYCQYVPNEHAYYRVGTHEEIDARNIRKISAADNIALMGRPIVIRNVKVFKLKNVLGNTSSGNAGKVVKHIGLQARPGFMFSINDSNGIRVGRTGIYEPIVNYDISSV